ncbi:MAG: hypothetical protein U5K70_09100 [Halodesulfurarchaeum sp.]|nr:hypothetical protein [Halodesulfurarchaeum sp.]
MSPTEVEAGSTISVTVTISNPEAWPATGAITSSVDGAQISTWTLNLDVNETVERTAEATLSDPGEYIVEAGLMTEPVTVLDSQATTVAETTPGGSSPTTGERTVETTTPGFTLLTTVLALLLAGGRLVR